MFKYLDCGPDDMLGKVFDFISIKKLEELSEMAFYDTCVEYGCNIPEEYVGKTVPTEESYSKFEIAVWHLMKNTVRDGMTLDESFILLKGE